MSSSASPPGWHPDPFGRHQVRYWDGSNWSEHVADNGVQATDAPVAGPGPTGPVVLNTIPDDIRRQVSGEGFRGAGIAPGVAGGGTIFTEPVLVVNQKAKLIEVTNQYAVFDQNGGQLGYVNEIGQTAAKKVMRVLSSLDQFFTHRLEVCDMSGAVQLRVTRPAKVFKSTVVVSDGSGTEIGKIVQQNMIGKIHFGLEAGGYTYGAIHAENWRAWNFRIENHEGREIARITKTWEGLAKTLFTTADNYVVQIHEPLQDPLRALVVASALCVDTALKQDERGLN